MPVVRNGPRRHRGAHAGADLGGRAADAAGRGRLHGVQGQLGFIFFPKKLISSSWNTDTNVCIIIIMFSFVCCFSELEHIVHHKAKNKVSWVSFSSQRNSSEIGGIQIRMNNIYGCLLAMNSCLFKKNLNYYWCYMLLA